jgi:hypothetical protein
LHRNFLEIEILARAVKVEAARSPKKLKSSVGSARRERVT